MQIVIAGKDPTAIEEYLCSAGHRVKSFYVNNVCLDIAKAYNPDVFIYMEDVNEQIKHEDAIKQIQEYRILMVTKKDNPIIPYAAALGVKDYVFLPTDLSAILNRIENPATMDDAAEILKHATVKVSLEKQPVNKADSTKDIRINDDNQQKQSVFKSIKDSFKPKKTPTTDVKDSQQFVKEIPQPIVKAKEIVVPPKSSLLGQWFVKSGVVQNGQFIKYSGQNIDDILDQYPGCDAVILPVKWGIEAVKKFRRDARSRAISLIVIGGTNEFISAGADRCVKKITPAIIQDVTALSMRIRELWASVETDTLTGVYTRRFLNQWVEIRERLQRPFSCAILDLDKFKNVNDMYGHQAGDVVLSTFGSFLKNESRDNADFVARYGGEEFFIGLPNTTAQNAHIYIDRILQKWSQRVINTPGGINIKSTFSAGVAEWYPGCNVIAIADKMLYEAKETGRNRVRADLRSKILLLGQINRAQFNKAQIDITYEPLEATVVISDTISIKYAPRELQLYILGNGKLADWTAKRDRPDAIVCSTINEIINKIINPSTKTNLSVLPGARANNKSQTIPEHGTLYVVCPSRPALAGEVAAKLCQKAESVALVCAVPESTGALSLGISTEKLITSDWRIPGSDAPVTWIGVVVWPVDPYKFINSNVNVHSLVDQIKSKFALTVVDCGGSLDICSRVARDEGVLVLRKEGDASDTATTHWLKTYGGNNVMVMNPSEIPDILAAENGFVVNQN